MSATISEDSILKAVRQVPAERWPEILHFVTELQGDVAAIRTAADLSRSDLVGLWGDRDDLGDSRDFARRLRQQAETRQGTANAVGH